MFEFPDALCHLIRVHWSQRVFHVGFFVYERLQSSLHFVLFGPTVTHDTDIHDAVDHIADRWMETMKHTNDEQLAEDWEPCPPGTLANSAAEQNSADHDRRMFFVKTAIGVFLGAAGIRAYINSRDLKPNAYEDFVTCYEVKKNLVGYVEKTLDDKLSQRIALHLKVCTSCLAAHKQKVDDLKRMTEKGRFLNMLADNRRV